MSSFSRFFSRATIDQNTIRSWPRSLLSGHALALMECDNSGCVEDGNSED